MFELGPCCSARLGNEWAATNPTVFACMNTKGFPCGANIESLDTFLQDWKIDYVYEILAGNHTAWGHCLSELSSGLHRSQGGLRGLQGESKTCLGNVEWVYHSQIQISFYLFFSSCNPIFYIFPGYYFNATQESGCKAKLTSVTFIIIHTF